MTDPRLERIVEVVPLQVHACVKQSVAWSNVGVEKQVWHEVCAQGRPGAQRQLCGLVATLTLVVACGWGQAVQRWSAGSVL